MSTQSNTAYVEVLQQHARWLKCLARSLVADDSRADDLLQDVWLAALRSPPEAATARAWFRKVLKASVLRERIKEQARRAREVCVTRGEAQEPGERAYERSLDLRRVHDEVLGLEEPYRGVLLLRFFEGLPPREIARQTGVPLNTVKTRLQRGMDQIRARLDREFGDRRSWCCALIPFVFDDGQLLLQASRSVKRTLAGKVGLVTITFMIATGLAGLSISLNRSVITSLARSDAIAPGFPEFDLPSASTRNALVAEHGSISSASPSDPIPNGDQIEVLRMRNTHKGVAAAVAVAMLPTLASAQWTTSTLAVGRAGQASTSVGTKAMFAGGTDPSFAELASIDVYDDSTGGWSLDTLTVARTGLAATSLGTLALFGGGRIDSATTSDQVDIYDDSTGTWSTAVLSTGRTLLTAVSVNGKAIFAGGAGAGAASGAYSDVVDIYDSSTGTWTASTLSVPRSEIAAASVGSKALFGGGWNGTLVDTVDIYDASTGTWSAASLSVARSGVAATTVGSKVFFAGGIGPNFTEFDVVDIYDNATGIWTTATLSAERGYIAAITVGSKALFAGGSVGLSPSGVVDIYDNATGLWSTTTLSTGRIFGALGGSYSASVGNKALIAGGLGAGFSSSDVVDIFSESLGTNYCGSNANSTGAAATISAIGSAVVADNNVTLGASALPTGSFGFFLTSRMQGLVIQPGGSQGNLCLGGAVGRYVGPGQIQNSGSLGEITLGLDLNITPTPNGPVSVQGGETWYFTAWYRDAIGGVATSNFTDGLEIAFL